MTPMQPGFVRRSSCPVCGSSRSNLAFSGNYSDADIRDYLTRFYGSQGFIEYEYLEGVPFNLRDCSDCGAVYQEFIPNDALMIRVYEHWIDPGIIRERNDLDDYVFYSKYPREVANMILHFNRPPASLHVFDFGMGWGKWLLMAKGFGCQVAGAELSEERIRYARERGVRVITWEEIPQEQFDFINTEQVFEHIPEPLETLRHLSLALKPEGVVKISVPNGNGIGHKLKHMDWKAPRKSRRSLMQVSPLEHINCYRSRSIVEMARRCGLRPVRLRQPYMAFASLRELMENLARPYYYRFFKKGSICLYFTRDAPR